MSTMPPPPPMQPTPPPPAPPAKKTSILVWIAAGCGVLLLVVLIVLIAGGIFIGRKAKEFAAGAEKNPALVVAKMIAAANPDIEVVAEDTDAGTLTLRNKKTGEIITMNAEDIKDGKISFKTDKGGEVKISGSAKEGEQGFKIESDEGTLEFGAGASTTLPDWLPAYPGAESRGTYSGEGKGKTAGAVQFETPDSVAEVMAFYEKELKGAGFTTEATKVDRDGSLVGGTLTAKDEAAGRTVTVVCTRIEQATQGLINYEAPQR
jgi:hypothetical protein